MERLIRAFSGEPLPGWEQAYLARHGRRFADTLALLPPAGEGDRLLDVGIFPGHIAALAAAAGYAVDGLGNEEMTDRFLGCAGRAGWGVSRADVETDRFPAADDTYRVVVCTEIVEHLYRDPFHLLSEAFRVLKPGGVLILTTPNLAWHRNIFRLMGGDSYRQPIDSPMDETFPRNLNYGHYREYTMRELVHLLAGQDKRLYRFEVERRVFSGCWDNDTVLQALKRLPHPLWSLLTLRNWLAARLVPPWRSCLMVRALKPETACWVEPESFTDVSGFGPVEEDAPEPGPSRRRLESPFRWTGANAGFSFRHPAPGRETALRLRLARLELETAPAIPVTIRVNGLAAPAFSMPPGKQAAVRTLPLPRGAETVRVELEAPAGGRGAMLLWERLLVLGR